MRQVLVFFFICVISLFGNFCPVYAASVQETQPPPTSNAWGEVKDGAKEVYGETKETVGNTADSLVESGGQLLDEGETKLDQGLNSFWESFYSFHSALKNLTPLIFVGSIVIGSLVVVFSRKNKSLRQNALRTLCIAIPLITLIIVFVMPYFRYFGDMAVDSIKREETHLQLTQDQTSSKKTLGIYNNVLLRVNNVDTAVEDEKDAYKIWTGYKHLNVFLKSHLAAMITGCELFGIFVIALSRKDKMTRKWAGISLCFVMPVLLLMIVYFVPVVQEIFV